jgi:hypothetical protein
MTAAVPAAPCLARTTQPFLFTNEFFVNFASTPPNALDAAGAAQFLGAWRADALAAPAGNVTQFRDGNFRALDGTQSGLVPASPVTSVAYSQPLLAGGGPPGGPGGGPPLAEYMRLPTDMALVQDAVYRARVALYATGSPAVGTAAAPTAGSAAFFDDFAASMQKMHELGVPSAQLYAVATAPATAVPPPAAPEPPAVQSAGARRGMPASHAALLGAGVAAFAAGGCPFAG